MSIYFVKNKGWRYDFNLLGIRHTETWFKTKEEAQLAESQKREELPLIKTGSLSWEACVKKQVFSILDFMPSDAYSTESDHRFHAIPITHSIDSGQGVGA